MRANTLANMRHFDRAETTWRDSAWQELCDELGVAREKMPSRRRWMKWEAPIPNFCRDSGRLPWMELAQDREIWKTIASDFVFQESDRKREHDKV